MCHLDSRRVLGLLTLVVAATAAVPALGGWPADRRARRVVVPSQRIIVPTQQVLVPTRQLLAPTAGGLGTFYPDRYLFVAGNGVAGGGYSPLDMYGPTAASLYGPLSAWRSTSAPVNVYSRGYDGAVRPGVATSFSYPNEPDIAPVVYPTRGNYYYGFRRSGTPPQWDSSVNWIDQD